MPAALSIRQRQEIIERRKQGEQFTTISRALNVSYSAVRNIYHRYKGTHELGPAYDKCCHTSIRKNEAIYHRAVEMKQAHPSWGAGLIWVELAEEFAEEDLPSQRTLQRWFRRAGVQKPPTDRQPTSKVSRGKTTHEVWAIDAKEQIKLSDDSYVSWIAVTDEASGAILDAVVFPHQDLVVNRPASDQAVDSDLDGEMGMSSTDAL